MNKKAQVFSLLYSGLLLFIVIIESLIVVTLISRGFQSSSQKSDFEFQFYGPVVPVIILTDLDVQDSLFSFNGDVSDLTLKFRRVLNLNFPNSELDISIKNGELPSNDYYFKDSDYEELFYYPYQSDKYIMFKLSVKDVRQ